MLPRVFKGRKLLVASIGVAAVTYACNKEQERPYPVGNLMAPMRYDAGEPVMEDSGHAPADDMAVTSGNLMAPPPIVVDAGSAASGAGKLDAGGRPDAGKKK